MTKPTEILLHDAKVEMPKETIAELMRKVIVLLGEDPNREGLRKTPERFEKAARYILNHQNADGGWSIYAGGPSNISASVKAYFGLKLAGFTADHPALELARKKILEMGSVTEVNTFTKLYLCFFGQYDYDAVPAIPPEIVLFPKWFWFVAYHW